MKKYDTTWIEKELEKIPNRKFDKSDVDLLKDTLQKYGKETFLKYLEALARRYKFTN